MKSIKNLLLTAAAVVTATVAATAVISFGVQAKYGDINNDGSITDRMCTYDEYIEMKKS